MSTNSNKKDLNSNTTVPGATSATTTASGGAAGNSTTGGGGGGGGGGGTGTSSKEPPKLTTVIATKGKGDDETEEISYTDAKVIGNGSFGVVYQAKIIATSELVAIKKVLQDRRYKVKRVTLI